MTPQPQPPAIELNDVEIRYGEVTAVREVSLRVKPGELHVLLGKSGSGKTSLLRAIAGFEATARGTISLHGAVVDDSASGGRWSPPEERHIGLVFQDYALFPHLTVAENIGFGMERYDEEEVGRWLERVGMPTYATRRPSELSGGEQQRVALARALAQQPSLMLLDEPFSNLDLELRRRLRRDTVELLKEEGVAAVFVTHDATEAFSLADRLSVMHASRLLQSGTAEELYYTPATREVAVGVGDALFLGADAVDEEAGEVQCALGALPLRREGEQGASDVMLRPEQIRLYPPEAADRVRSAEHTVVGRGRVLGRRFLGATTTLDVEVRGEELSTALFSQDVPAGDEVLVAIAGRVALV